MGLPRKQFCRLCFLLFLLLACRLSFLDTPPPTPTRPIPTSVTEAELSILPAVTPEPLTTPPPTAVVPPDPTPIPAYSTSQLLGPGVSYTKSLNAGETAVFQLPTLTGHDLMLVVRPQEGLDAAFSLTEGQTLLHQIDDYGPNEPEFVRFSATAAGPYTIRLTSFAGTSGRYTINLYDLDHPDNSFLLNITDSVVSGDVNSYTINQLANHFVIVFFDPTDFDGLIEIYEPTGFLFSKDEGQVGEPETAVFIPTSDGDYLIRVFGFRGDSGNYALRIIALP